MEVGVVVGGDVGGSVVFVVVFVVVVEVVDFVFVGAGGGGVTYLQLPWTKSVDSGLLISPSSSQPPVRILFSRM